MPQQPKLPTEELISRARSSLSRLARFTNRLQRTQLSCGPVTVQQCHTLEALMEGPLSMRDLSNEVAIHQSTLTRVVEKLEAKALVGRQRRPDNRRVVEVELTTQGRQLYEVLDAASNELVGKVLTLVAPKERKTVVKGLELLCNLLDPKNEAVQALITGCCCAEVDFNEETSP